MLKHQVGQEQKRLMQLVLKNETLNTMKIIKKKKN